MARILLALALLPLLASCGSDSNGGTGPSNDSPTPTSLTVSPATTTMDALGATTQFTANVRDQNGQSMAGVSVGWSSANPGVLSINASGLATAVSVGSATVTATAGSATGSASATVQQVPAEMELSFAEDHVVPGGTVQGSVQVKDSRGNAIPGTSATWSSGDEAIATVDPSGLVTGVAPGLAWLKAEAGSLKDSVQVSVAWGLDGQQVIAATSSGGEAAIFTTLGGGTHLQIQVADGSGKPIEGASVHFAEVGERALLVVRGPGDEHVPAFLFGSVDTLAAFGEAYGSPSASGAGSGEEGPERSVSRSILLRVVLPLLTTAELAGIDNVHLLGTFLYQMLPTELGLDELRTGNLCMTWEEFVDRQRDFLELVQLWADAVISLIRGPYATFFDPNPLEGRGAWHFDPTDVLASLLAEDVLGEALDLLGEAGGESVDGRMVRVEWEFGDGGPAFWNGLGYFRVLVNDPHCGGAIPGSIQPVTSPLIGGPGSTVTAAVLVNSTVDTPVPELDVTFSLAPGHGTLEGGSDSYSAETDEDGIASVSWTLPPALDDYTVTATALGEGETPLETTVVGRVAGEMEFPPLPIIAGAGGHSCGLTTTGSAFCWGYNWKGEVGDGTTTQRFSPTPVSPDPGFASLVTRGWHSCGLAKDGKAYCWGANHRAQLGDGTTTERHEPTEVAGSLSFEFLTAGWFHNCGLTADGKAYCWGYGQYGEVGDGTSGELRPSPVEVSGGLTFKAISAGGSHTCGLASDGTAYCWGYNVYGELGDGSKERRLVPTPVSGSLIFKALATGVEHTCGLSVDGATYCWGRNQAGQLGDGTTTQRLEPVQVTGDHTFSFISSGLSRTCGLTPDGDTYCWGLNTYGGIGDGTFGTENNRATPTQVTGGRTFTELVTGYYHSCGLTADGALFCWGHNAFGQIGDGTSTDRPSPVQVTTIWNFGRPSG